MCGCSGTGVKIKPKAISNAVIEPCDYTVEQLQSWNERLLCVKNSGLSQSNTTINIYLGVIQSALNTPAYICFFKLNLDIIFNYIQELILNNICNE